MAILKINYLKTIVFLVVSTLFFSCSEKAKDIFNPTTDNIVEFSLSKKQYNMEDIIKRQSQIKVDSGKYLLRFSTDNIRKDTTIDAFNAYFFEMDVDTVFYVIFGDTIDVQMIIRRDSVGIEEADLESGVINLRLNNYTAKPAFFQLTFPGFTKRVGTVIDTLIIGGPIPPNSVGNFQQNLSGFKYKQPLNQPFGATRPGFWLKGKIFVQGGTFGDSIRVYSHVQDIRFNRMKGRFKPLSFGVKEQTMQNVLSSDISEFITKVTFDSIRVKMIGSTTIDFPIRLQEFRVKGLFNSGRPPIFLTFGNKNYLDTTILSNGQINLNFDNTNSNINSFLSAIPDSISISSSMVINPYFQSGEVLSNDSISFSFQVDAWSRFAVNQAEWTDTFDIDISKDARDKMKKAEDGKIIIYSTNEVPFETELVGIVTDSFYKPLLYLTKNQVTLNDTMVLLNGAITNPLGEVISPAYQTVIINLNKADIENLSRGYKLIQRFSLSTTEKRVAEVSAKSKVNLKINGRIKIKLTSDDF